MHLAVDAGDHPAIRMAHEAGEGREINASFQRFGGVAFVPDPQVKILNDYRIDGEQAS
jgi:hypothetical protein